jgi:3-oxoacyl-[acyl-carrier protein] reductase
MSALRGKCALVTGGATGFGFAAAQGLAAAGAGVAICGRRAGKLAAAAAKLSAGAAAGVFATTADVTDPASVEALVQAVLARFGRLDIVVNNAGVLFASPFGEAEPSDVAATVATNLVGAMLVTRAALEPMKRADYGRIVNVTSGLAWKPIPGFAAYAASKAGVNQFTRTLAAELAGWNIRVNALDPGVAQTELNPGGGGDPQKIVPGLLRLATLPMGGPTGQIFKQDGETLAIPPP